MHPHGIDAFGYRDLVRSGNELPAVNDVRHFVNGQDQVFPAIPYHRGDRVWAGIRGPRAAAVVVVVEAKSWVQLRATMPALGGTGALPKRLVVAIATGLRKNSQWARSCGRLT